ncbi:MAG: N-acyl-D-amino-acid deacylase family protein [Gammaproteobacteria bacterium]
MQIRRVASAMFALLLAVTLNALCCGSAMASAGTVELLVQDARLLDGSGAPPRPASVGIAAGRIAGVYPAGVPVPRATRVIDAKDRVLAPGFIDLHAHGDPLATPTFENALAMGVTTIVLGQDGESPDPNGLKAWQDAVAAAGPALNVATLVGHGTLRRAAGVGQAPLPDAVQTDAMLAALDGALDDAFGLSLGLEYAPGLHAGELELRALARVVGARDRVIMSHLRSEDDAALPAALDELLRLGLHARVHVAHLKSVFGHGSARAEAILGQLDMARRGGVEVTADLYPYTASYTGLDLLFPAWAKTAAEVGALTPTRRAELAAWLRDRVNARNGARATLLGTPPYAGRTLAELADTLGKPFEQVLLEDLGPEGVSAAYFVMDEALQDRLLVDPHVAIASDGSPTAFHPRGHGTFARVIEVHVTAQQRLALAEAVRKMTSLPADILGLSDRGRIAPGLAADLVLFDPSRVTAPASYTTPFAQATGFDVVIVNGAVAREAGAEIARHGQVLRPAPHAQAVGP